MHNELRKFEWNILFLLILICTGLCYLAGFILLILKWLHIT